MFLTNTLYWETEMLLGCTVSRTHCFISEANLRGSLERSHRSFLVHLSKWEQRGTELTQSQAGRVRTTLECRRSNGWTLDGKSTLCPVGLPSWIIPLMPCLELSDSNASSRGITQQTGELQGHHESRKGVGCKLHPLGRLHSSRDALSLAT